MAQNRRSIRGASPKLPSVPSIPKSVSSSTITPMGMPSRPWNRIHIDYAGPFMSKMFLLVIDAYSKWLDIHLVNTANTQGTLTKLRETFATHGLPEVIVSDNGTVFTSEEFKVFCQKNGIRHYSSLHHTTPLQTAW